MTDDGARVLYLSYTGVLEPLGSQIHPLLVRLARHGHTIDLVTWEKPADLGDQSRVSAMRARMASAGITWNPLRYHKSPTGPATLFDVARGTFWALLHYPTRRWNIIHIRSYVPGIIAVILRRVFGTRFLFDMRGFWADEYLDVGTWGSEQGWFRRAKKVEQQLLRHADAVVVLTHAAKRVLLEGHPRLCQAWSSTPPPIAVIPTCTDTALFHPMPTNDSSGPFVVGYVGSIGTWYEFDAMAETVSAARKLQEDIRFLVVTRAPEEEVRGRTRAAGLPDDTVTIAGAEWEEVPEWMARMNLGLFFITPVFSKIASCATKMGEFLACGIPVVTNAGIGDSEQVVTEERVGTVARSLDLEDTLAALSTARRLTETDPEIGQRCRSLATSQFDIQTSAQQYDAIYRALFDPREADVNAH